MFRNDHDTIYGKFLAPNATPQQVAVSRTALVRELNRMRESVIRNNPELAAPAVKAWKEAQEVVDLRRAPGFFQPGDVRQFD